MSLVELLESLPSLVVGAVDTIIVLTVGSGHHPPDVLVRASLPDEGFKVVLDVARFHSTLVETSLGLLDHVGSNSNPAEDLISSASSWNVN